MDHAEHLRRLFATHHPGTTLASPLDGFIPTYDARERFQVQVQAPAPLVFEVGAGFDLQSIGLVRAIFRLRSKLLRATSAPTWRSDGFLTDLRRMGWAALREEPGRLFIGGAHCQPWLPDVTFVPLSSTDFQSYAAPGQVKIAWTLEAEPLGEANCWLRTETRVVATDPESRRRFLGYWRWARFGIFTIRWLVLPCIRRQAEARYRLLQAAQNAGTAS